MLGGVLLPIGIVGAVTGNHLVDFLVIPGILFALTSMLLFGLVIRGWRRARRSAARRDGPRPLTRLVAIT